MVRKRQQAAEKKAQQQQYLVAVAKDYEEYEEEWGWMLSDAGKKALRAKPKQD